MDTKYLYEISEKIFSIDSPSSYTQKVIEFLDQEARSMGYSTSSNRKGNLLITVEGKDNSRTIGVSAHTDTLGLMVRSINDDGTLKFTLLGGPQLPTLDGEYCRIHTRNNKCYTGTILSTSPSSHVYPDAESLARNCDNMMIRIDENVKSKEDVLALGINNGDIIAIDPKTTFTESGFIKSRFLDDKISVACLFEILHQFKETGTKPTYRTVFIISTYEEVGHGASSLPELDELLACDMGCIGLDLSCTEYDVSICAKDSSGPYDYGMVSTLISLAKENDLPFAVDVYPFYGSDVSAALRGGNNIKGALIGPGVHASHGMERTHIQALEATVKLMISYLCR